MTDYLDGPGLCAWLEQNGIVLTERNVLPWRRGACVSVWRADYRLTQHDIHLSQLPDWLWIEKRESCEVDMAEVQAGALVSLRGGEHPQNVAKRWDLDVDLVKRWAKEAGVVYIESLYCNNAIRRQRYRNNAIRRQRERRRKKKAAA